MDSGIWELDVNRLMGSEAWRWSNNLFAQYMRLLVTLRHKGGYLPNDSTLLAHYANAWEADASKTLRNYRGLLTSFIDSWTSILRHKFQLSADQSEIFHPRILEQLQTPQSKAPVVTRITEKKEPRYIGFSFIGSEELQNLFNQAYKNYPRHLGKRAAERAFFTATTRLAKKRRMVLRDAGIFITQKCADYSESPAGKKGVYTPHMSTWLNQDRFEDDPAEWERETNAKTSNLEVISRAYRQVTGSDAEPLPQSRRDDGF